MEERFRGCLLGLALGDALGAPFEGGVLERATWRLVGLRSPGVLRYTDDGEMALGCAESLAACGGFDADHMARTWAERASWSRGYGPGARAVLRLIRDGVPWREAATRVFPEGSFGNGAAMRAAPLGLWFHDDPERLDAVAREASSITHAHPLGIQGGVLVARATALALHDEPDLLARLDTSDLDAEYRRRLGEARAMLDRDPSARDVAHTLGRSVLAHESAVTAVYLAARFRERPFEELVTFVVEVGGDVDTLAAMAGGVWGAARGVGALPADALARLEDRDRFDAAARRLRCTSSR
jgi:ADP-ribosylglycohydrolase